MANKNYFTKQLELSNKEIRGKRAEFLGIDAKKESKSFIDKLKSEKRDLERELMNLEDFNVSMTTSLKVSKDGFNVKVWVENMNRVTTELFLKKQDIKIAKKIHKKYFGNESINIVESTKA